MYFLFHSFVLGVLVFPLSVTSFFGSCNIYLHFVYILFARNLFRYLSFLVCGTYRLVASGFIFSSFGFLVTFSSSYKFPRLFLFVVFQYFSL